MGKMPELPDFLTEPAQNAFFRIYRSLESRGLWNEFYLSPLEITSMTCYNYLNIAKHEWPPSEIEEMRILARKLLADFYYIPESRIHLAVINSDGLDSDIVDVCEPFRDDYLPAA